MNTVTKITACTLLILPLLCTHNVWANVAIYQTSSQTLNSSSHAAQPTYYTESFYNTATNFDNFSQATEFTPYHTNNNQHNGYGFNSYEPYQNTSQFGSGWYDAYNTHESSPTGSYPNYQNYRTYSPNNSYGAGYDNNRFDDIIQAAAKRHNVDPALIKAIIHTESDFNPYAQSHAGAQGLMQLMPATADRFGVYNVFDPQANINAGTKYIAWLINRYAHNLSYALAGYNAGEGNVDKYNGIPPFAETQNYVNKVLNRYYNLYQNDSTIWYNN